MTLREWEARGIRRVNGKPFPRPDDRAHLLVPAGSQGPAFLMLNNFRVMMKYNPAEAYAIAIGHLADRLRGGGPFVQPWPRHERVLSRAERRELQELLLRRGFDGGEPTAGSAPRPVRRCATSRPRSGSFPTALPRSTCLARLRGR